LYSPISKEIYNFQGCYFHCHDDPNCVVGQRILAKKSKEEIENIKKREINFLKFINENFKEEVSKIHFIYECEWDKFKKCEEYKTFALRHKIPLKRPLVRLNPRIAQRGGLLEVYNLNFEKDLNNDFFIADINSLYPFITMSKPFPIGCPKVLIGEDIKNITIKKNKIFYKNVELYHGLIFAV